MNRSALLLDIEGTTTPVAFVYDVLFPFAREGVAAYLRDAIESPEVRADVERLRSEHAEDARSDDSVPAWDGSPGALVDSVTAYVHWLMDRDRKSTGLKSLQGKIWENGYRAGALKGQIYDDVLPALVRWKDQGRRVSIFSSGSVLAQKLLFGHSEAGDLTGYLDGYFDTTTGPKKEAASYAAIASAIERAPADVLFLSDVVAELDAAHEAGMQTLHCVRPGTATPDEPRHTIVEDFAGL